MKQWHDCRVGVADLSNSQDHGEDSHLQKQLVGWQGVFCGLLPIGRIVGRQSDHGCCKA